MLPEKVVFATNVNSMTGAGHIRRLFEISKQLPASIEKHFFGTIELTWVKRLIQEDFLESQSQENYDEDTFVILDSYEREFCLLVNSVFPHSKIIQLADRFTFLLPRAKIIFLDLPFPYEKKSTESRVIAHGIEFLPVRHFESRKPIFVGRAERVFVTTGGIVNDNIFSQLIQELVNEKYRDIEFEFMGLPKFHDVKYPNIRFHELGNTFDQIASLCDSSISAAGTTLWDLLANQILVGSVAVVENQKANLNFAVESGQALEIFDPKTLKLNTDSFQSLLFDENLRQDIFLKISGRYDFYGAKRISEAILSAL